jgi:carbamoyl-phosphate synthase large subunit
VHLVVNTPRGRGPRADGAHIRRTATVRGIPCLTTVAAAIAAAAGIAEWGAMDAHVAPLQEYHRDGQMRLEV